MNGSDYTLEKGPFQEHAERLAALEMALKNFKQEVKNHFATKAWVLGGVVVGIITAVGLATAIVKYFLSP